MTREGVFTSQARRQCILLSVSLIVDVWNVGQDEYDVSPRTAH